MSKTPNNLDEDSTARWQPNRTPQLPSSRPHAPAPQNLTNTITIVSGLPRSGTSLLMQMLERGGIDPLTDGLRTADEDNRKGYYEYDKVKRLRTDNSWVKQALGKSTKVVAQLLKYLPANYQYRVIYMQRNLDEVIASQTKMLERSNPTGSKRCPITLKNVFFKQSQDVLQWLDTQTNIEICILNYAEIIADPATAAHQLRNFLGEHLDIQAMIEAVDASLYRNRSEYHQPPPAS